MVRHDIDTPRLKTGQTNRKASTARPQGCTHSSQRGDAASPATSPHEGTPPTSRRGTRVPGLGRTGNSASGSDGQRPALRPSRPFSNTASNPTQALWTPSSITRERRIFFETRVSGQPEVWAAIALAVDMVRGPRSSTAHASSAAGSTSDEAAPGARNVPRDLAGAQSVLDAAGVSVPRGRLEDGAWDERGVYYAIPPWVLSDPVDFRPDSHDKELDDVDDERDIAEKDVSDGEHEGGTGEVVKIRARLSDRAKDVLVSIREDQSVGALIKAVREGADIPSTTQVKICYLGKVLRDGQTLAAQGWRQGHVVNALVFT